MSLNCLTCQSRQTTDPDLENEKPKEKLHRVCFPKADHNWSGPLVSPPREQMWEGGCPAEAAARKRQKGDRGLSTGTVKLGQGDSGVGPSGDLCLRQPRLVRCSGMRRDWSFEELREIRREGKRKERR